MQVIPKDVEELELDVVMSKIYHINSIGAIIDNCLLLYSYSKFPIEIETIRRAEILKTKINSIYKLLFIVCAIPLIWTLFIYHFTQLERFFIYASIAFLFGCAYFIKNSKYILFIRKMNVDCIEFEVNKHSKDDAKKIVNIVNKKIRQLKVKSKL